MCECELVYVHARVCPAGLGAGRNRNWILEKPETQLSAYRHRGAATNRRGRSLSGWGGDIEDAEFRRDQRKVISKRQGHSWGSVRAVRLPPAERRSQLLSTPRRAALHLPLEQNVQMCNARQSSRFASRCQELCSDCQCGQQLCTLSCSDF
ncbi:hypothetical protein TREES_T100004919 [Tupaia chinensis]|uniref:Uncharacterized protein n=1 Tax=Tupaia chinensis TaxID=246437 RepID=L9LE49_TUPCH|nr:hypothetical protein TREES_T100004919 [Tupaia chinensis]